MWSKKLVAAGAEGCGSPAEGAVSSAWVAGGSLEGLAEAVMLELHLEGCKDLAR